MLWLAGLRSASGQHHDYMLWWSYALNACSPDCGAVDALPRRLRLVVKDAVESARERFDASQMLTGQRLQLCAPAACEVEMHLTVIGSVALDA